MILPETATSDPSSSSSSSTIPLKIKKGDSMTHPTTSRHLIPPLQTLNSAFQLAEYLSLLIQDNPHDIQRIVSLPQQQELNSPNGSPEKGKERGVLALEKERNLWIYEHLRRLPIDLTLLTTSLLPVCNRSTCPDMRAGEWQYICVAHPPGTSRGIGGEDVDCCAIDYFIHTLDSTTAALVSTQSFPSRLQIKSGSEKQFGQLARRISRVFGHAYHHHREVFEECEAETSLYKRFVELSKLYNLVPAELLVIPDPTLTQTISVSTSPTKTHSHDFGFGNGNGNGVSGTTKGIPSVTMTEPETEKGKEQSTVEEDDDKDFSRDLPVTTRKAESSGSNRHHINGASGSGSGSGSAGGSAGGGKTLGRGASKRKTLFPVTVGPDTEEEVNGVEGGDDHIFDDGEDANGASSDNKENLGKIPPGGRHIRSESFESMRLIVDDDGDDGSTLGGGGSKGSESGVDESEEVLRKLNEPPSAEITSSR